MELKRISKKLIAIGLSACMLLGGGLTEVGSYIGANTVVQAQGTDTTSTKSSQNTTYQFKELRQGTIMYDYEGVTKQFACEQLNGIYFLNDNVLSFYSLSTNEYKKVYEFSGCNNAYIENNKLYVADYSKCYVYDIIKQKLLSEISLKDYTIDAVGADTLGRIYLGGTKTTYSDKSANYRIFLYSSDGKLLSKIDENEPIYAFNGFDRKNGNFYFETSYNWLYWGYDHPGHAISMGNVTNNVIKNIKVSGSVVQDYGGIYMEEDLDCIEYCCQDYYNSHKDNAALLGGKYLTTSSITFGRVMVKDSNSKDLKNLMTVERAFESNINSHFDTTSIGVRAVYNKNHNSIIMYENGKKLSEYNPETGKKLSSFNTKYCVFNLLKMANYVIAIEKNSNKYYMEIIDWSDPKKLSVTTKSNKMKVGDNQILSVSNGKAYNSKYIWSSSDKSVVTVSSNGKLAAWSKGKAVITCQMYGSNIKSEYTVNVTDSSVVSKKNILKNVTGKVSYNLSDNNYSVWSSVVNSYLIQNKDNTLTRVEYINNKGVIIEKYSLDYKLLSSKTLKCELPIFGGFYSGKNYNFLVFGQSNPNESNNREVLRVVKYDKSWKRLGSCSVKGANTYIPFDAGSLRMTETNGLLYIHTCHEMYADSNKINHQANMTFVINESSMKVKQSYYDIMNFYQAGYVSHSFNQFIQTDGKYIYRIDHGDANPRAVTLSKCLVGGDITDIKGCYTLQMPNNDYNYNATGVSVGGFELSSDNCLIAGNSVNLNKSSYDAYGQRNVFVNIKNKNLSGGKTIWLTHYKKSDGVTPNTPHLVKLNDEHFCVIWEEYNNNTDKTGIRIAAIDGSGTLISCKFKSNLHLSDCKPIVTNDGMIRWYVSNGDKVSMYALNPYQNIKSKLTNNSTINKKLTAVGNTITINGAASGGTITYKYAFYVKSSSAKNWTTIQSYSTTATKTWKPDKTGKYYIRVNVNDGKTTVSKTLTINVVAQPLANTSKISKSTIYKGESINITGAATGGTKSYKYEMYVKSSSAKNWTKIKSYSTTATKTWKPDKTGKYYIRVNVNDGKTTVSKTLTLNILSSLVNKSTVSKTTVKKDSTITITGAATGGAKPYKYSFYVKSSSAKSWTKIQSYSTTSKKTWKPTKSGKYQICTYVKDANGKVSKKIFTVTVK